MGRWITQVSAHLMQMVGSRVVYGDTDSLFVVPRPEVSVGATIGIVHRIFDHLSLTSIRFDMEQVYESVIVVKKKMYYATVAGSEQAKVKGLAYRRQDRIDLARWAVEDICRILTGPKRPRLYARAYLVELFTRIDSGLISPFECLTQVKVDGVPHFRYKDPNDNFVLVQAESVDTHKYDISRVWVRNSVARAVDPIVLAVGLGSCEDLVRRRY